MYDAGEKEALLRLLPSRVHLFLLNNIYIIALYLTETDAERRKVHFL